MRFTKKIKIGLTVLAVSLFGAYAISMTPTVAADSTFKSEACSGLTQLNSSQDCSSDGSGFTDLISTVVQILGIVVGIVAVIMVIVAGFKYTTSGGDANSVSSAKSTLVYALIGIAIAALAQFLVHFVFNTANNSTPGTCQYNSSLAANDAKCKPPQ